MNLTDLAMKTMHFQPECTFKPSKQRFKRKTFHLARHLLLVFALKPAKIFNLDSAYKVLRLIS